MTVIASINSSTITTISAFGLTPENPLNSEDKKTSLLALNLLKFNSIEDSSIVALKNSQLNKASLIPSENNNNEHVKNLHKQILNAIQQGQFTSAFTYVRQATKLVEKSSSLYCTFSILQGDILWFLQRYEEAIQSYKNISVSLLDKETRNTQEQKILKLAIWRSFCANSLFGNESQALHELDRLNTLDIDFNKLLMDPLLENLSVDFEFNEKDLGYVKRFLDYMIALESPIKCCDECSSHFYLPAIVLAATPISSKFLYDNHHSYIFGQPCYKKSQDKTPPTKPPSVDKNKGNENGDDLEKCFDGCDASGLVVGLWIGKMPGQIKMAAPVVGFGVAALCKSWCKMRFKKK